MTFGYISIVLLSKLSCTYQFKCLKNYALWTIIFLPQKLDFRKRKNFFSANALMRTVAGPSATYEIDVFQKSGAYFSQLQKHLDKNYHPFQKQLCWVSKWTSNWQLWSETQQHERFLNKMASFATKKALAESFRKDITALFWMNPDIRSLPTISVIAKNAPITFLNISLIYVVHQIDLSSIENGIRFQKGTLFYWAWVSLLNERSNWWTIYNNKIIKNVIGEILQISESNKVSLHNC